jgi:hypothetical protein
MTMTKEQRPALVVTGLTGMTNMEHWNAEARRWADRMIERIKFNRQQGKPGRVCLILPGVLLCCMDRREMTAQSITDPFLLEHDYLIVVGPDSGEWADIMRTNFEPPPPPKKTPGTN